MNDLIGILVLLAAYGGLAIIGVAVLLIGAFAAQRTTSVVACAVAAALLFAAQFGWLAFWLQFAAFGDGGPKGWAIAKGIGFGGAAFVIAFLAFKLPRARGGSFPGGAWPQWPRDGAKIAALLSLVYALLVAGVVAARWAYPYPGIPVASPATLVSVLVASLLAWGLWRHHAWAWYGALACAGYVSFEMLRGIASGSDPLFFLFQTSAGLSLFLLLPLLGVLLFSNARRLCLRPLAA